MDNVDERLFSGWEMQHLFSDNWKLPSEHAINLHFPMHGEQQQNLLSFSPLPSPTSSEEFAVTAGHLPYESPYNAPRTVDLSMATSAGPCQPLWSQNGISAGMTHQKRTSSQMPPGSLRGWSRDYEPSSALRSIPNSTRSLSQTLAHSYPNTAQYDAYMAYFVGNNRDTSRPSLDWDTASGFFHAFDDYPFIACSDSQPSIAPTHSPVPPTPSAVLLGNEQICGPGRQTQTFCCQWLSMNGSSCDRIISAHRRGVIDHLQRDHGIKPGEEKARQTCLWEGCTRVLNKESLARHILTVHIKGKVHCAECGLFFAREDSLKRHLKGSQHKLSSDKTMSRNRSGSR